MDRIEYRKRLGDTEETWMIESETPFSAEDRDRILTTLVRLLFVDDSEVHTSYGPVMDGPMNLRDDFIRVGGDNAR